MNHPTGTYSSHIVDFWLGELEEIETPLIPEYETISLLYRVGISDEVSTMLNLDDNMVSGFENRLYSRWSSPLDLLKYFRLSIRDIGNFVVHETLPKKQSEVDNRFLALNELHTRACQVSGEIICLLAQGYADGALARWRSLHETAVNSHFIFKHGEETADRFLDYQYLELHSYLHTIDSSQALDKDVSDDVIDQIDEIREKLIDRYGLHFDDGGYGYGWAAHVFDNKSAAFSRIETDVGLDYLRPLYKLANNNVHSGSTGSQWNLGDMNIGLTPQLAGPSNYGLKLPGRVTPFSLWQATVPLLLVTPSSRKLGILSYLWDLGKQIGEEFQRVQKAIEADEHQLLTGNLDTD